MRFSRCYCFVPVLAMLSTCLDDFRHDAQIHDMHASALREVCSVEAPCLVFEIRTNRSEWKFASGKKFLVVYDNVSPIWVVEWENDNGIYRNIIDTDNKKHKYIHVSHKKYQNQVDLSKRIIDLNTIKETLGSEYLGVMVGNKDYVAQYEFDQILGNWELKYCLDEFLLKGEVAIVSSFNSWDDFLTESSPVPTSSTMPP